MGRTSKRGGVQQEAAKQKKDTSHGEKRYQAGIYARLSSDHGGGDYRKASREENKELQKEGLKAQIEIAKKYVEEFNQGKTGEVIDIVRCYTDLGKTGSNFERAGFLQLLQDIRLGEINCVIVKDLSRFGRNYLEAGDYIEKIFPFLGVRFIAVSDEFDTGIGGNENKQMDSEIRNLVNDMYAKDFSQKAKVHLKQKREEGSYVGGPPPYGYLTHWDGKRRVLIPDENTAKVVRFIYERFVETESYTAVADALNNRRVSSPSLYRKTGSVYRPAEASQVPDAGAWKGWNKSAVERILKSETYAGTLVQGKTGITARNEKNRIHKPKEDWVVTRNAHKPLVDRELYLQSEETRQKIQKRTALHKHPAKQCPPEENIFDRILYCGVCGRKMKRSSHVKQHADGEKARIDSYCCLSGGRTKTRVCLNANRLSGRKLMELLLPLIRMEFAVLLDEPERYREYGRKRVKEAVKEAEAGLRETEGKIRRFYEEEGCIYKDYRMGRISQKDYGSLKRKQENKLADCLKQLQEQKKELQELDGLSAQYRAAIEALPDLPGGEMLTKDMAEAFISKIDVYPDKRIEVLFAFTADGMEGVKGNGASGTLLTTVFGG